MNKIVIRFADGKILKGITEDFFPNKEIFHLKVNDSNQYREIKVTDLKCVFFVKSFEGNREYVYRNDIERLGLGRKISVQFKDGEIMVGYTQGYSPGRTGCYSVPCRP